jgi:hypothetical protein
MEQPIRSFYCRGCGYCLDHLEHHRCPECGREFDPARPKTMSRKQRSPLTRFVCKLFLGMILLMPAAYFTAYALCVQIEMPGSPFSTMWGWPRVETYSHGGAWAKRVFGPANWIDRHIRRDHWEYYGVPDADICTYKAIRRGRQLGKPLSLLAAELLDELQWRDLTNPKSPEYSIQLAKIRRIELDLNAACDQWEATH